MMMAGPPENPDEMDERFDRQRDEHEPDPLGSLDDLRSGLSEDDLFSEGPGGSNSLDDIFGDAQASSLDDLLGGAAPQAPSSPREASEPQEAPREGASSWRPETAPPSEPVDSGIRPSWLDAESPEPQSGEEKRPAWLHDAAEPDDSHLPQTSMLSSSEPEEDIPEWMKGLTGEEQETSDAETPLAPSWPDADLPEWMGDPAKGAELPDWMSTEAGETTSSGPQVDLPGWMQEAGASDEELPDWMQNVGEQPEIPAPPGSLSPFEDQPASPSEPAPPLSERTPAWLQSLGFDAEAERGEEPEPPLGAEPEPSYEIPAVEPESPSKGITDFLPPLEDVEPVGEDVFDLTGLPDWLEGADLAGEPGVPASAPEDDLLGFAEPFTTPPTSGAPADARQQPAADDDFLAPADMPEWLRGIQGEMEGGTPEGIEVTPELADQIRDLRYGSITAQETPGGPGPEKVGALKDVTGVIQPEMIFEGTALSVGDLVDDLVVTDQQQRQAQNLSRLLRSGAQGQRVAATRGLELPLIRLLVVVVLLAAVALPLVGNVSFLSSAVIGPGPVAAHTAINNLAPGDRVMAVFEYEPDASGEMAPLAQTVMQHVAERQVDIFTISTRPAGTAMAQQILENEALQALRTDEQTWLNLGYVPGDANGVSALALGGLSVVPSSLASDYLGNYSGLAARNLPELEIDMVIVFSSRVEDLRPWVEQVGPMTGTPILAVMSASSAPLANPYLSSGQLVAVLGGINDAVGYQAYRSGRLDPDVGSIWNAQAAASIAASALILVGALVSGAVTLIRRQEQM